MVQLAEKLYSAEDLLEMEDGDAYELDDGSLMEQPVGLASENIATRVGSRIEDYLSAQPIGVSIGHSGLQIFPDRPNRIPRADAGFISYQRLAQGPLPGGHLQVPPELAIEVISPRDEMEYVHRKIREYLGAGVDLVWVILPEARTAEVYRRDGTVTYIQPDGALDGEDVLPGFHCPLAGVMPLLGPTPSRRPRR